MTGRLLFSFAASSAARASCKSVMVSMAMRSAPAFTPARTISANISTAASKGSVPKGSKSSPRGPMSSATFAGVPSQAFWAALMADRTTSSTVTPCFASLRRLAPKVLAYMTSVPALTYCRWMPLSSSGLVRARSSGVSPGCRPDCWSMVPMAPSRKVSFFVSNIVVSPCVSWNASIIHGGGGFVQFSLCTKKTSRMRSYKLRGFLPWRTRSRFGWKAHSIRLRMMMHPPQSRI